MDPVLTYNFDEIDVAIRQDIHTTSSRLNNALEELRSSIAPLQQIWTREAAQAYQVQQARWQEATAALNDMLFRLGNAVGDGAQEMAEADRRAAGAWG